MLKGRGQTITCNREERTRERFPFLQGTPSQWVTLRASPFELPEEARPGLAAASGLKQTAATAVPQPDTPVWKESALPSTSPRAAERLPTARRTALGRRAPSPRSTPGSAAIPGARRPRHAGSCSPRPPSPPRDLLLPGLRLPARPAPGPARPPAGQGTKFSRAHARWGPPALPGAAHGREHAPRPGTAGQPPPSPLPFPSPSAGTSGRVPIPQLLPPRGSGTEPGRPKPSILLSLSPAACPLRPSGAREVANKVPNGAVGWMGI